MLFCCLRSEGKPSKSVKITQQALFWQNYLKFVFVPRVSPAYCLHMEPMTNTTWSSLFFLLLSRCRRFIIPRMESAQNSAIGSINQLQPSAFSSWWQIRINRSRNMTYLWGSAILPRCRHTSWWEASSWLCASACPLRATPVSRRTVGRVASPWISALFLARFLAWLRRHEERF